MKRREPAMTLSQARQVIEAAATSVTMACCLVSDSAAAFEAVDRDCGWVKRAPVPKNPRDKAQWRAFLLAALRHAVEVLEGGDDHASN